MARLMAQPCPDGGIFSLEWQRASPQQRVALLYAPERGLTRVPPGRVCGGLMLNLSGGPLTLIGVFRSDVEGAGSLSGLMQPHSCGGHLQFIDLHGCTSTNVLRLE